MKTTTRPMFSNGTEHMRWMENNCYRCLKYVDTGIQVPMQGEENTPQYRCSVQRDIEAQLMGCEEVSYRSYTICQMQSCPYRQGSRNYKVRKHRPIKGQMNLFDND